MRKFSNQSVKELQNSVRRFNMMRTNYVKQNGTSRYLPRPVKTSDILNRAENTKELREYIKTLQDVKTVNDFALVDSLPFKATKGELNSFNRLQRRVLLRTNKEIKKLNSQLSTSSPEKAMEIIQHTQDLARKVPDLNGIKNRETFISIIKRMQDNMSNGIAYGDDVVTTKDHYLAALKTVSSGFEEDENYKLIYSVIEGMSKKEFHDFVIKNKKIGDVNYLYEMLLEGRMPEAYGEILFALEMSDYIA